jgi:hypothetical protein
MGLLRVLLTICTILFSVALHETVVKKIDNFRQRRVALRTADLATVQG